MKRKMLIALIAILSFGLVFVGCGDGGKPKPPLTKGDLTPWAPASINEPADYEAFPKGVPAKFEDGTENPAKDGLLGYTAFYAGSGGEGYIEDNGGDTYKVTVLTNPGGISLISFQDDDYIFKTGFYMSLDLPVATETAPYKPIGMIAFAASGPQETNPDWSSAQRVNLTGDNTIEDTAVYLAGRVDFAWENNDNAWPRRTLCLYIYWHADEKAGAEYTFTLNKISHPAGENLSVPAYPGIVWAPPAIPAPTTGWKDFPSDRILAASALNSNGSLEGGFKVKAGGGYTGTVAVTPGGFSQIQIPGSSESVFLEGYYLSLELPISSGVALHPNKVATVASNNLTWPPLWISEQQLDPIDPTKYVGGNVDIQWYSQENNDPQNAILLDFYFHPSEPAGGTYTFTLKALKIAAGN